MIFSKNRTVSKNGTLFHMVQPDDCALIMEYLERYPYNIWEFSFAGMVNDLEFGDLMYREEEGSLTLYFSEHQSRQIHLYAPPFCERAKTAEITEQNLHLLKQLNGNPYGKVLRVHPDDLTLFADQRFFVVNTGVPFFTIHTKQIVQSTNLDKRLRRACGYCEKNYGKPELKKYTTANYNCVVKLRSQWRMDAETRGVELDGDEAFLWLLGKQADFGLTSFEVYLEGKMAGFISFAPHHGDTGINLFRFVDNGYRGLSGYSYLEALRLIAEQYQVILDGSGVRQTLYEFKKQFTDDIHEECSVQLAL